MASTHFSGPVAIGSGQYESLITTRVLTNGDNGKIFGLNSAGGFTVTLPSIAEAKSGWTSTFRVETAPTTAYIITEKVANDTNVLTGGLSTAEVTSLSASAYNAAFTQVNLVATKAVVGDTFTITCNGTRFYVTGHTNLQAGVTLT